MIELLKSPFFVTKLIELVLSVICALLLGGYLPSDSVIQIEITHTAIFAFILINLIVIIAYIFEEPLSSRLTIIISGAGTVFYVITTIILFSFYMGGFEVSRRILATAFIVLLEAVIFAADCFFTCKYVPE